MDYFLESIAKYLFENKRDDFKDITLVFPNRRSGLFFQNELMKLVSKNPIWSPTVFTINEFMLNYSNLELANQIQLLSELYLTYKKLSGSSESFDNFYSWGEIILADFNDIDKYLINAESLFVNVKNFKSIENQIDFLSEEQLKTLERFFEAFDADKSTKIKEEFIKIWEVLLPLYTQFKQRLRNKKIGYEGMVYQDALKKIEELKADDYSFKKLFFIGFNAITPAEEEVFSILKNIGLAEFFWDFDEYYINNYQMEAGLFQRKYINKFPPVTLNKDYNQLKGKKIKLISTPTDHGQVYAASQILGSITSETPSDTAVILSDEQLLLPTLNSIPSEIKNINITMGYPVKDSLTGNFVDLLIQAQQNIHSSKNSTVSFYYKNVISILRHPFTEYLCPDITSQIIKKITRENLFQLNTDEFNQDTFLSNLFIETKTSDKFTNYLEAHLKYLHEQLWLIDDKSNNFKIEKEFLFNLWLQIKQLNIQLAECNIKLQLPTYFQLIRKVIRSTRVPFEGEPIKGLQIMGFLETRNLDFKNVIILSVNEGVIPTQNRSASFIPFSLRRGFGLPTGELNDAMFAYYFYRIIQRAENVWLLYNSGAGGMSTGEKSRLIYQLEYDNNFEVDSEIVTQTIDVNSNRGITISKDSLVWENMQEYLRNENPRKLSPSSLSIYLQCPLRFYYKSVAKITEEDEIDEVIDARLFGNIFHNVAEKIYTSFFNNNELITSESLNTLLKDNKNIDEIITNSFTEVFYGENTKRRFKIEGKNQIIFDIIKKYLKQMLKKDIEYAPFSIVGLEKNVETEINININSKNIRVKVGGQVDRIDRTDRGLRIIDYKTGSDKLEFNELEDVFNPEKIKDTKAVFQTFIYSYIISKEFPSESSILPMVYQVKELFKNDSFFDISSKKCTTYKENGFLGIKDEVEIKLKDLLEELFDRDIPFTQTENAAICEYCPFKEMCGR